MDPATQGVPDYYVWQVPGQKVSIHLRLGVVDRMAADIMRGFGAVPKRGAEVGGILIGTVTRDSQPGGISTIRIEDFETVPCSYTRGPSYLLTDAEREAFDDLCQRRNAEMVGYFRSHTRDGLTLQAEDIQLLDEQFPAVAQVALLVKPFATKPSVAGFFVRENGVFPATTPLEFPFRRREMTGEEPPRRQVAPTAPQEKPKEKHELVAPPPAPRYYRIFSAEPKEPPDPQEKPTGPRAPYGPKARTGMWLVAAFVFLLLGVLLGYEASLITAPRRASDFAMALTVERAGQNLTVHWNPNAPAVRSAGNGVLEIEDGSDTKRVELDRANLSSGSMVYRNTSDKVSFRLVVYLASGLTVTETLEWPR